MVVVKLMSKEGKYYELTWSFSSAAACIMHGAHDIDHDDSRD